MDAVAHLALMTKAKLVFERPDTFLSFPALTPLSYPPDQLNFGTVQALSGSTFLEFCLYTNSLPQGVLFELSDTFLWDVLWDDQQGLFAKGATQLATGSLTGQESADLKNAQAVLYVTTPDGLLADSPFLVAYKQYRDAWFKATQDYNTHKITADFSNDPKVKAQWQDVDEPQLRAKVQSAEDDWNTKGYKAKVEQAQQVEQACAVKDPHSQWGNWQKLFDPMVDLTTDPNTKQSYALTAFSPSDILDQHDWPSFTLSGPEIQQLVSQAPSELKNIFQTSSGSSTIESLSFEFCSVSLGRSWFPPQVLNARFWRFADPSKQLSDGMVPPKGQCPAYVTALVFARNIVVTTRSDTGTTQSQPVQTFPAISPIFLRPDVIKTPPLPPAPRPQITPAAPPAVLLARLNTATFRALPATAGREVEVEPSPSPRPQVIGRFGLESPVVARPAPAAIASIRMAPPSLAGGPPAGGSSTPPPPPPPPPPAGSPQQTASDGRVSILAFICKSLPKCPNPDPMLDWGS